MYSRSSQQPFRFLVSLVALSLALLWLGACGENSTPSPTITYKVSFNSNGGTAVDSQTVNSGSKATKPTDPTKVGYLFTGWYKDTTSSTAFNFDTTSITANITLYAKWVASITITYNSNGGTSVATQTLKYGDKITKPANPTYAEAGVSFAGWYSDATVKNVFDFSGTATTSLTLYAKWTYNIPDANFKTELMGLVPNAFENGLLMVGHPDVLQLKNMQVSGKSIRSLAGIQFFTGLNKLSCFTNSLSTLDISKNTDLMYLDCGNNSLSALDVSKNTKLTELYVTYTAITYLELSNNPLLQYLYSQDNQNLVRLTIKNTPQLKRCHAYSNPALKDIDIRGIASIGEGLASFSLLFDQGLPALETLKIRTSMQAHAEIKAVKTQYANVVISTYDVDASGNVNTTPTCANYDPNANSGAGKCN